MDSQNLICGDILNSFEVLTLNNSVSVAGTENYVVG